MINWIINKMLSIIINLIYLILTPFLKMVFAGWKKYKEDELNYRRENLEYLGGTEMDIMNSSYFINMMYFDVDKCKVDLLDVPEPKKFHKGNSLVILFCGSNGVYERSLSKVALFLSRGFSVLTFNYPGYGKSGGSPSVDSFYDTAEAVYDFANKHMEYENILIYSISLGSGPASYLSTVRKAKFMMDRPFAKLSTASKHHIYNNVLPNFAKNICGRAFAWSISNLVKMITEFDNVNCMDKSISPIVFLYAEEDEMIPEEEIKELTSRYCFNNMNFRKIPFKFAFKMEGGHGFKKDCWIDIEESHSKLEEALEKLGFEMIDVKN